MFFGAGTITDGGLAPLPERTTDREAGGPFVARSPQKGNSLPKGDFLINHRPENLAPREKRAELTVSRAIEGYLLHKNAQGLSQRTVSRYKDILEQWAGRLNADTQAPSNTSQDLKRYLVWKMTEYILIRKNGKSHPLSPKTTRNIYVTFQAFFRWIGEEFEFPSPMKGIPVPKFVLPRIEPLTKDEIVSLIKACVQKRESRPSNRRGFTDRQPHNLRDQTDIKFLLDTGLRASEFASLRISDVDLVTGRMVIQTGKEGGCPMRAGPHSRILRIGRPPMLIARGKGLGQGSEIKRLICVAIFLLKW